MNIPNTMQRNATRRRRSIGGSAARAGNPADPAVAEAATAILSGSPC
jgi:hypothetical protein